MLGIDIILGLACLTLLGTNVISYKVSKRNKALLKEKELITEHMLLPGPGVDDIYEHEWQYSAHGDVVYKSKNPMSFDRVVVNTATCRKCQMVHRYIVQGNELARSKGVDSIEGFYYNGIKVPDHGCPIKSNEFRALPGSLTSEDT